MRSKQFSIRSLGRYFVFFFIITSLVFFVLYLQQRKIFQLQSQKLNQEMQQLKEENVNLKAQVQNEIQKNGVNSYMELPACFGQQEIQNGAIKGDVIDPELLQKFFSSDTVHNLKKAGGISDIYEICYSDQGEIAFVAFGNYGDANNIIGIFSNDKVVTDSQYNPSSGDMGLCRIIGYIERNVLYSCGGGDGPISWNRVLVLNRNTGESTLIKDCTFDAMEEGEGTFCKTDIFHLDP